MMVLITRSGSAGSGCARPVSGRRGWSIWRGRTGWSWGSSKLAPERESESAVRHEGGSRDPPLLMERAWARRPRHAMSGITTASGWLGWTLAVEEWRRWGG